MARKAKEAAASNGFDPETCRDLIGRLDDCRAEKLSVHGSYMADCGVIAGKVRGIYDEAKERNIPVRPLKKFVAARVKLGEARKIISDLEKDDRDLAHLIAEAAGDDSAMPLFVFAKARKKRGAAGGDETRAS